MLKLAPGLKFPVDAVTQTFAIFGKRGSGKSNTATVMAEEMFNVAPFVVLTPLDSWWGLKASFDGKGTGLKVYVCGGDHGDLPLDPEAGELMARLFIEHRISMVLCMKGWSVGQRAKFVTAFALYLLGHNGKVPVHVFLEEADAFIPQRPYKGEEAMLGAMDRLVRWGRGEGIGATLITQRSAKVNKDVTTQCETLIAHRTIGPQDRDAIDQWIKFHADQDKRQEALMKIAGLADGQAIVWSPEWLSIFGIFSIRRRQTFDSASTPKVGEKRVEPKHLAVPDLAKLRDQLATTIEQAKVNDPRELRRQIADLKKQLLNQQQVATKVEIERIVEVEILPLDLAKVLIEIQDQAQGMAGWANGMETLVERAKGVAARVASEALKKTYRGAGLAQTVEQRARNPQVDGMASRTRTSPRQAPLSTADTKASVSVTRLHDPSSNGELNSTQQRILDAMRWLQHTYHRSDVTRAQVAFIAHMKPGTGHFNNMLGSLRTSDLIHYPSPGRVGLTEKGRDFTAFPPDSLTDQELQTAVLARLNSTQAKIVRALILCYPEDMDRETLATSVSMASGTGHFNNVLGSLRTLGLADYPSPGRVVATSVLFLEK